MNMYIKAVCIDSDRPSGDSGGDHKQRCSHVISIGPAKLSSEECQPG